MMVGWIKLYRLLLESALFQNAYALQVFIYLLLKAAYKEMKIPVGNKNIILQPGQLLYGRKSVAQKLNMGEGKLRGVMEYLENNGSIEIESYSKYSIVTIVNWEKYQVGEVPEFPFDVDFLDDEDSDFVDDTVKECAERDVFLMDEVIEEPGRNFVEKAAEFEEEKAEQKPKRTIDPFEISWDGYKDWREESYGEEFWNKVWGRETEPAKNRVQMQAQTGFQNYEDEILTSREPQYNNINKYKNNKINNNKTRENNKKTKENKTKENHKNLPYRQSDDIVYDCDVVERVAGLDTSQEMLLSDGAVVSKGKVVCGDSANGFSIDSQTEAFDALSSMDDSDMPNILDDYRRPGHEFVSEMVYDLTPRDMEQLDAMFKCCSVAAVGYDDSDSRNLHRVCPAG